MSSRIKIKEGIDRGKCGTCQNALIRTDVNGQQAVLCTVDDRFIPRAIAECSAYTATGEMGIMSMHMLAWHIQEDNKKPGGIGFLSPKELRERG